MTACINGQLGSLNLPSKFCADNQDVFFTTQAALRSS